MEYDYDKLRENYHSLLGLKDVFKEAAGAGGMVTVGLVVEYERFLAQANQDLPGLLVDFNKSEYFSHDNGGGSIYYRSDGIRGHIERNLGILKVKVENTTQTPVTETRSFSFVTDAQIKGILERDYQEIQRGAISHNWKSVIILSGGSIEAILLDLLQKDETTAKASTKAPREPNLNKWNLNDLIEVAVETRLVGAEVAKLSHSVREYRNLIHPGVEVRSRLRVEPEESKIAIEVLNILIRELS
jgi:hypothetical protein